MKNIWHRQSKKKGFTLVEIVVSLFIFSILMISIAQIFTEAFSGHRYAKNLQRDIENIQYLSGILSKELRTSTIVDPNGSQEGVTSVQFYDYSQGLCIQYRIRGTDLEVAKENAASPVACNGMNLSNFTVASSGTLSGSFDVIPSSASPRTVGRVTFTLRLQEGAHSAVVQSTVSLRDYGGEGSGL